MVVYVLKHYSKLYDVCWFVLCCAVSVLTPGLECLEYLSTYFELISTYFEIGTYFA